MRRFWLGFAVAYILMTLLLASAWQRRVTCDMIATSFYALTWPVWVLNGAFEIVPQSFFLYTARWSTHGGGCTRACKTCSTR